MFVGRYILQIFLEKIQQKISQKRFEESFYIFYINLGDKVKVYEQRFLEFNILHSGFVMQISASLSCHSTLLHVKQLDHRPSSI